jgi:selenocysteine-specific elongation factor
VLDPLPPRRGIRTATAAARLERIRPTTPAEAAVGRPDATRDDEALTAMIEEAGMAGFPIAQLASRAGVPSGRHDQLVRGLEQSGRAVCIGGALFDGARLDAVQQRLVAVVSEHHARHPLEEGIPREELRDRVLRAAPSPVLDHVLQRLVAAERLVARDRVALRGHSLALTDEEARVRDGVARIMDEAALMPPDRSQLAARVGASPAVVERMTALLVRQHVLARVGDLIFHEAALRRLKAQIRSSKADQAAATIDVATFKDRYHVSRKYAIPLLEFLDRERVTRRAGDVREIL